MFTYKSVKTKVLKKIHTAHKSWTVTDSTAGTYGIVSYSGYYSDGDWDISDPSCTNIALETTSSNGYYKREIFDSIHHLYYTDPENAYKSYDSEYLLQQTRNLNSNLMVLSIPSKIFGNRIKENSFTMSSDYANIYDDGIGNLRDSNIADLSGFKKFNKSDYIIKCDFNDGFKFQTTNPNSGHSYKTGNGRFVDISDGPFTPVGKNVTFGIFTASMASGSDDPAIDYGASGSTFITFHGSQSIETGSNSFVQIENSVVLGTNEKRWDEDFSLSLWVYAPSAQAVTGSFTGGWVPLNTTIGEHSNRQHEDNTYNVITTSRMFDEKVPWELQIYNASETNEEGKIRFIRGNAGIETSITSTAAINDEIWHHVVIQVATGSMQLWLDGNIQGEKVDPVVSESMFDASTDLFIGVRPWGFKTREHTSNTVALPGSNTLPIFTETGRNYIHPFKGSVNNYRLYNKALTTAEITSLNLYVRDSDIVGNLFYNHGFAVLTDQSGSYRNMVEDYTMNFKATTEHKIHNYKCVVEDEEFNVTFNPSAREYEDKDSNKLKGFVTSSDFTPYITTIGLYNDQHELLAISKLANPVQSPKDLDIVFNVQFDT